MIKNLYITLFLLILTSCTVARKFNFNEAYKFGRFHYQTGRMDFGNFQEKDTIKLAEQESIIEPSAVILASNNEVTPGITASAAPKLPVGIFITESIIPVPVKARNINPESTTYKKMKANRSSVKMGYRDAHPALKGFILVLIGFGVVLLGALVPDPIISGILVVGGFVLAAVGFYKMIREL